MVCRRLASLSVDDNQAFPDIDFHRIVVTFPPRLRVQYMDCRLELVEQVRGYLWHRSPWHPKLKQVVMVKPRPQSLDRLPKATYGDILPRRQFAMAHQWHLPGSGQSSQSG